MGSVWLFSIILINCSERKELWSVWGGENFAVAVKKTSLNCENLNRGKSTGVMRECWGSPGTNAPRQSLCFPKYQNAPDIFLPISPISEVLWEAIRSNESSPEAWARCFETPPTEVHVDPEWRSWIQTCLSKRRWAEPITHQELVCLRCKPQTLLFWQELLTLRTWKNQVQTHFS